MPLPAPLAFVWNQLRRLVLTPYDPEPGFDGYFERAQTESNDRAEVTVAVLSGREAQRLFGVPVNRRGIQPVFVRVENRSTDGLRLQVVSLDPSYFTPLEAASVCHFSILRRVRARLLVQREEWQGQVCRVFCEQSMARRDSSIDPGRDHGNVALPAAGWRLCVQS